jgi:GT2 family glycosyltransferase
VLPSFSIVIPSHNRPDLLKACLHSISDHLLGEAEVLVVDDGSRKGIISSIGAAFPGVRVMRFPRRQGFCTAANAGVRTAHGTIVELLNDDTEVTPGWAEAALARFADSSVVAVAPLVLRWPGRPETVDSAGDRYYLGGIAGKRGHRQALSPAYLRPCRVFGASGSSAFFRRDVFLKVGGFPEAFGAYFEDVDLAFRLNRAGYQVVFEPASRVLHHVSASHGRQRRLLEQQSRNEERVFWRNIPSQELVRAVPHHFAVLAAKAWRRWREGRLAPFLSGRLSILAEISELRRHRYWLQHLGPDAKLIHWRVEDRFWG